MPRHPPCALQHFTHNKHAQTTKPDTKKMLASTMQHSTHHHTPTPTTTTTPTHARATQALATGCVRRSKAGSGTKKTPTTGKVSPQDPTVCRTMFHDFWRCVPPSHTPPTCAGCGNNKKENPQRHVAGLPPHTGKLLRKEVIQPHLPVRLPCYDFVPIAGPTFDHSPPQVG